MAEIIKSISLQACSRPNFKRLSKHNGQGGAKGDQTMVRIQM